MEIVGSIDRTHPRSNGGRESVERLSCGVDSGDLLHRVIKAADRQDAAAPANKSEVRATLRSFEGSGLFVYFGGNTISK